MKRLKLKDKYYKIIDGFEVNESSREVKYSNVKIDFTGKGIADLPLKYQECQLLEVEKVEESEGQTIEGTSFSIDYDKRRNFDYFLKGQTSQSGTPTPSSPVAVETTTGEQVVRVCEKNLFNIEDIVKGRLDSGVIGYASNTTALTLNSNSFTFTTNANYRGVASGYISVGTATNICFSSSTNKSSLGLKCACYDENKNWLSDGTFHNISDYACYFTLANNTKYIRIHILLNSSGTITINNPQIEYGNSSSTYEEYKGNDYEINLGKNLFDLANATYTTKEVSVSINDNIITQTNTNTYARSIWKLTNLDIGKNYTFSCDFTNENGCSVRLSVSNSNDSTIIVNSNTSTATSGKLTVSFTATEQTQNLRIYSNTTGTSNNYSVDYTNLQLEKGSKQTTYAQYKTPIYLGKIGTYQDCIFKNTQDNPLYDSNLEEGQWYIHKEIGKVVLNGSESGWNILNVSARTFKLSNFDNGNGTDTQTIYPILSSHFLSNKQATVYSGTIGIQALGGTTKALYICFGSSSSISDVSALNTWLSSHNVEVYYVLNTPTNTLIEDEELINQLNGVNLLNGLNNISVSSANLPALMNLHYNFNEEYLIEKDIIYTGYVNNYTLPKMKNKLEYRELDIDLLSPLALATLRTADAVGTYNLQDLIKEIIQPLIDDGFTLKELNVGNNQISVNYLIETIESALNKLSNKFNFWWYIDKNKNIYINNINSIFNKEFKINYDDNNKIDGLIDFTPKMESIDYCNTLDFTNLRLITKSHYRKDYYYTPSESYYYTNYYNPIFMLETINPGDEIEFDIPFIINTKRKANSQTMVQNDSSYFKLEKITVGSGGSVSYTTLVNLTYNEKNEVILPNNVEIADSYNDNKEFVFVRDSFFSNLIVGMKYNGNSSFNVGKVYSETALMYTKIRINDNKEISNKKDIISKTGIIEKQINMNEQWVLYEDLVDIANSLIRTDSVNVEIIELKTDIENELQVGDIIYINKPGFLTYGKFIITDKKRTYYDNVDSWVFNARNTNILESYIDLFRATEEEETSDKVFTLISSDYSIEGIIEEYEVEIS